MYVTHGRRPFLLGVQTTGEEKQMNKAIELAQRELALEGESTIRARFVGSVIVAMHSRGKGALAEFVVGTCRTAVITPPYAKPMPGEPYRASFGSEPTALEYYERISNRLT